MQALAWPRRAQLSIAALALFVVTLLLAVSAYPGGSWFHPLPSGGFSWLENFWCDLLREPAHGGAPNARAVWLATVAFAWLALSLWPFWLEVSTLLPRRRARFLRVAGPVSALATACVALMPSDRFPLLHAPVVLTAGGLGFVCGCACSAWALTRARQVPVFAAFSAILLVAAAVNLALYVAIVYFDTEDTVALPAVQKLATVALVGWIASGLAASAGRPKP
jgi:hypothetical protein